MRLIFTILFLWAYTANAITYYVSNSGNDANLGTSQGSAWKTIAKVNSFTFLSGDQILFNAGDTWNEALIPPVSNLSFDRYGTGANPLITGFAYVTGFTHSGNIWSTTFAASKTLNNVTVNGTQSAKGRYPNSSYLLTTNGGTDTTVNTSLTGTPNYTGAEIVVKEVHFIIDVSKVKSQVAGTLSLSKKLTYSGNSSGYFFQNTASLLDTLNEWSFDSSTNLLSVYASSSPTVQASNIDTLVYINGKSNISFNNINFSGANMSAFQLNAAKNITVNNFKIYNIGKNAFEGTLLKGITITNGSMINIQNCGVRFDPDTLTNISYNYLKNIGYKPGMGANGIGTYTGIYQLGPNFNIYGNKIDSVGYDGVNFKGNNGLLQYNYVKNHNFLMDDGGAYYTYVGTSSPFSIDTGTIVRNNIAENGIGSPEGTGGTGRYGESFYFDGYTNGILLDSNTSIGATSYSYYLNQNTNITARSNTAFSTNAHAFYVEPYGGSFVRLLSNITYNANSNYRSIYYNSPQGLAVIDSNFFMRPTLEAGKLLYGGTAYGQSDFVSATGLNSHGGETPVNISITPIIIYNPTMQDSVVVLGNNYINAKGRTFIGTATLKPFTSEILFLSSFKTDQQLIRSKFRNLKL